jgi:hypothetical protein
MSWTPDTTLLLLPMVALLLVELVQTASAEPDDQLEFAVLHVP